MRRNVGQVQSRDEGGKGDYERRIEGSGRGCRGIGVGEGRKVGMWRVF